MQAADALTPLGAASALAGLRDITGQQELIFPILAFPSCKIWSEQKQGQKRAPTKSSFLYARHPRKRGVNATSPHDVAFTLQQSSATSLCPTMVTHAKMTAGHIYALENPCIRIRAARAFPLLMHFMLHSRSANIYLSENNRCDRHRSRNTSFWRLSNWTFWTPQIC